MGVSAAVDQVLGSHADALTWSSLLANRMSAWHGHVGFAHWIMAEMKPRTVVELGTHNGVSFAAFCNGAKRVDHAARCYAVDSWQGDEHAGLYDDTVYQDVRAFSDENFPQHSVLLRHYFDEALRYFEDRSVDLLHIDGLHTYEAVKHDFDSWLPKMSNRGVVLLHDIEVREHGFGVWKLWDELTRTYPSFDFRHSAGLGVLAVGRHMDAAMFRLTSVSAADKAAVRNRFALASQRARQSGLSVAGRSGTPRNVALNCNAMQSSYYLGIHTDPRGALNGYKTGGSGFETDLEVDPWWMVDLGQIHHVETIVIYNRLDPDCRHRARTLTAMTSPDGETWDVVYRHDGSDFGGIDGAPLVLTANRSNTRFVRLQLADYQIFHLDEVEVYA